MRFLPAALGLVFLLSLALGPSRFPLPPWTALLLLSAASLARLSWHCRKTSPPGTSWLERYPYQFLFLTTLSLYLASFRWHGGDDIPNSLLPYCILGHGAFSLDPYRNLAAVYVAQSLAVQFRGHYYSFYPVAPAVLALPLYVLPVLFRAPPQELFLHNLSKISASIVCALSVLALYRALLTRCSARWAAWVALLYGLGTYAFSVSSQALYSHGPAQLAVALGILGIFWQTPAGAALSGAGFAASFAFREDGIIWLACAAAYHLVHKPRSLGHFALGAGLPIGLNAAYWLASTGTLRPPYFGAQASMFGGTDREALAAMLVSPTRGLLFFFPAGLLGVWGVARRLRDPQSRWLPYLALGCLATWLFYACRTSWLGGMTFGNRYFAVLCMVLALFCGELEETVRGSRRMIWACSALFAFGVLVHAIGAFFNWPGTFFDLDAARTELWRPSLFPPIQLFLGDGPMGSLPAPARFAAASALLLLAVPLAWWSRWYLARPSSPAGQRMRS